MKKPSINITIVEKLSKEDKASLETLHKQAFDFIFNRSSEEQKEHNEKFCSQKDIAAYVLAKEDKKLIGSVIVYQRFILLSSRPVSLGGIGGVAVDENYQHQ